jgi:hypothetical protein
MHFTNGANPLVVQLYTHTITHNSHYQMCTNVHTHTTHTQSTVPGARDVGHVGRVLVVVDTHHEGGGLVLRRSRENHLLHTSLRMRTQTNKQRK